MSFKQLPDIDKTSQALPNLIKKEESPKFFIAFLKLFLFFLIKFFDKLNKKALLSSTNAVFFSILEEIYPPTISPSKTLLMKILP